VPLALEPSFGGVFEVDLGEQRIFSKILLGRFPEEGEVLNILKAKLRSADKS
jgi:selenoprotein W-related protein